MKVAQLSERAEEDIVFRDGLGVRVRAVTDEGGAVHRFLLDEAFVPVQQAIDERVKRLTNLQHVKFARLRAFEKAPKGGGAPVIVSEDVAGLRLSDILLSAGHGLVDVEPGHALQVTREVLAALTVLHDSRNVTHGSLGPERVVLTPNGRVVVVEHVLAQALDKLQLPRHQLWRDWRIPTPPAAGPVRFDARTDLAQAGLLVLALVLGRPIEDEEYPHRLRALLPSVHDRLARTAASAQARELQAWLERLLPIESRKPFTTVKDAQLAFESLVSGPARSLGMSPARVKALVGSCLALHAAPAASAPPIVETPESVGEPPAADPAPVISLAQAAASPSETGEPMGECTPSATDTSATPGAPVTTDDVDIEALLRLAAELEEAAAAAAQAPALVEASATTVLEPSVPVAPFELVVDEPQQEPTIADVAHVAGESDLGASLAMLRESQPPEVSAWQLPATGLSDLATERIELQQQFAEILSQVAPEPAPSSLVQDAVRWTFEPAAHDDYETTTPWSLVAPEEAGAEAASSDARPELVEGLEASDADAVADAVADGERVADVPAVEPPVDELLASDGVPVAVESVDLAAVWVGSDDTTVDSTVDVAVDTTFDVTLDTTFDATPDVWRQPPVDVLPEPAVQAAVERTDEGLAEQGAFWLAAPTAGASTAADELTATHEPTITDVPEALEGLAAECAAVASPATDAAALATVDAAPVTDTAAQATDRAPETEDVAPATDDAATADEPIAPDAALLVDASVSLDGLTDTECTVGDAPIAGVGSVAGDALTTVHDVPVPSDAQLVADEPAESDALSAVDEPIAPDALETVDEPIAPAALETIDEPVPADALFAADEPVDSNALPATDESITPDALNAVDEPGALDVPLVSDEGFVPDAQLVAGESVDSDAQLVADEPVDSIALPAVDEPVALDPHVPPASHDLTAADALPAAEVLATVEGRADDARVASDLSACDAPVSGDAQLDTEPPIAVDARMVADAPPAVDVLATTEVAAEARFEDLPSFGAVWVAADADHDAPGAAEAQHDADVPTSAVTPVLLDEPTAVDEPAFRDVSVAADAQVDTGTWVAVDEPVAADEPVAVDTPAIDILAAVEVTADDAQPLNRASDVDAPMPVPTPVAVDVPSAADEPGAVNASNAVAEPAVADVAETVEAFAAAESALAVEPAPVPSAAVYEQTGAMVVDDSLDGEASVEPSAPETSVAEAGSKRRRSRRRKKPAPSVPAREVPVVSAATPLPAPPPIVASAPAVEPRGAVPSLVDRPVPSWQPPADLRAVGAAAAARRPAALANAETAVVPPTAPSPPALALVGAASADLPVPSAIVAAPNVPLPIAPTPVDALDTSSIVPDAYLPGASLPALGQGMRPPLVTTVGDPGYGEPATPGAAEPATRTVVVVTSRINWRRTVAAGLVLALLESAAFAAAWWWVQPGAKGTLIVETSVPGVEVLLDGASVGHTPFHDDVRPGRHTLTLRHGGLERNVPVEISLGVVTTQSISWPGASSGALRVTSSPEDAEVIVGGRVRGRTPLTIDDLEAGRHAIVLRSRSGTVSASATVVAGETTTVDVPIFAGWIVVHAPVDLALTVDGTPVGSSLDGQILLAPGSHRVEVSNGTLGFAQTLTANVEPGKVRRMTVTLPDVPLQVSGEDGAEVFVDGASRGTLPGNVTVPLGTHEVVLRRPDGTERRRTLTVRADAPLTLD